MLTVFSADMTTDIRTMSNEKLVKELALFASGNGVIIPSDPFWHDFRPEGWKARLLMLEEEVLRRLNQNEERLGS